MPSPDALAEFQDALLKLLDRGLPIEEIQERLQNDPAFAEFRDYTNAIEPRMLEVAVELMRKWGRKRTP